MNTESLDISTLSNGQKVALMERLWRSLDGEPSQSEPPSWHEAVLKSRSGEWEDRELISEDWTTVREELRSELS